MRGVRLLWTVGAAILGLAQAAHAHEFWIAPQAYVVPVDAPLRADLRVGQNFNGPTYSFVPANFKRFELVQGGVVSEVTGRAGDKPALNQGGVAPGFGDRCPCHQRLHVAIQRVAEVCRFCRAQGFQDGPVAPQGTRFARNRVYRTL